MKNNQKFLDSGVKRETAFAKSFANRMKCDCKM